MLYTVLIALCAATGSSIFTALAISFYNEVIKG